jgi:hypothetical protein
MAAEGRVARRLFQLVSEGRLGPLPVAVDEAHVGDRHAADRARQQNEVVECLLGGSIQDGVGVEGRLAGALVGWAKWSDHIRSIGPGGARLEAYGGPSIRTVTIARGPARNGTERPPSARVSVRALRSSARTSWARAAARPSRQNPSTDSVPAL